MPASTKLYANSGSSLKFALVFASLSILLKLGLFTANILPKSDGTFYLIAVNLMFILLAVFFSINKARVKLNGMPRSVASYAKEGMKSAAVFALTMALFGYIYYQYIDADYLPNMIEQRIAAAENADFEQLQKDNLQFSKITKEEFIHAQKEQAQTILSPFSQGTFTLFGYLLIGVVYSLLTAFLMRKVLKL
ncbi:MAG: hypothetical protein COA57_05290 [Flavobacteriales bacterium]|nr:MAG: hypothetical protein COA57_05290 [Flavobacteriales bacterium]